MNRALCLLEIFKLSNNVTADLLFRLFSRCYAAKRSIASDITIFRETEIYKVFLQQQLREISASLSRVFTLGTEALCAEV